MPLDKRLRGLSKIAWDNTPAAEGAANIFNNKVPRYMLYLMGHEVNENEFASMIENAGNPRHSVEFFEPVGNDFLERNFGDDGPQGELYRQDDIFFFDDNYSKTKSLVGTGGTLGITGRAQEDITASGYCVQEKQIMIIQL